MSSRDDEASDEKYSGNDDEPDGTTEPCAGTSKVCSVINTTIYGTLRRTCTSSLCLTCKCETVILLFRLQRKLRLSGSIFELRDYHWINSHG